MNLKETYNKIAADWHSDHHQDTWWVGGTDLFISMLKPGSLVLDAGCGAGTKSKYIIEHGLRVHGIDIADKLLEIAKKEAPEGTYEVMALEAVSRLNQQFDAIFAQASLLHVAKKDVPQTLESLNGKLKSGGLFYVAVKETRPGQPDEEVKVDDDYGYTYERFFSYFTAPELKKYFTDLGLTVVHSQVEKTGRTNWIQIIAKKVA
ncbi:MAG: class I SAM-dependent methyltransferase [bacterium]|nr:class I SAM-dependent methyltransferase [bacterium]